MRKELIRLTVGESAVIGAVSCSSQVEIFPILEQQCRAKDASVARFSLTLHSGESVVVGSGENLREGNRVLLTDHGAITIDQGWGNPAPEILPDGRLGLTVVRGSIFDKDKRSKVTLKVDPSDGASKLTFALNCPDRSTYPKE